MKRASVAVKPCASDSKLVLRDLLIIATVFVALTALSSTMLPVYAVSSFFYEKINDNGKAYVYYIVQGNQSTSMFTVTPQDPDGNNKEGSFVYLGQQNFDFFAVGFMKGWTPSPAGAPHAPNPHIWLGTPYYYVDRTINGARMIFG